MLRLVTVCRPAKAFIFYSGHPDVCIVIIMIIIIILLVKLQASSLAQVLKPITLFKTCIRIKQICVKPKIINVSLGEYNDLKRERSIDNNKQIVNDK